MMMEKTIPRTQSTFASEEDSSNHKHPYHNDDNINNHHVTTTTDPVEDVDLKDDDEDDNVTNVVMVPTTNTTTSTTGDAVTKNGQNIRTRSGSSGSMKSSSWIWKRKLKNNHDITLTTSNDGEERRRTGSTGGVSLNTIYGTKMGMIQSISMLLNTCLMIYAHVGISAVILSNRQRLDEQREQANSNANNDTMNVGVCNEMDRRIWYEEEGYKLRSNQSNYCSRQYKGESGTDSFCFIDPTCVTLCFQTLYQYSYECSSCFGSIPSCAVGCASQCGNNHLSNECMECTKPCVDIATICSGLTVPDETITTTTKNETMTTNITSRLMMTTNTTTTTSFIQLTNQEVCLGQLQGVDWVDDPSQQKMYVVYTLTFFGAVRDAWYGDAKLLAILVVLFSGVWPYMKNMIILFAWYYPFTNNEETMRNNNNKKKNEQQQQEEEEQVNDKKEKKLDNDENNNNNDEMDNKNNRNDNHDNNKDEINGNEGMDQTNNIRRNDHQQQQQQQNVSTAGNTNTACFSMSRDTILTWLKRLGKYTLVDIYAVIAILVGVLIKANIAGVPVIVRSEPRGAVVAFLVATVWEFIHFEWMTQLHHRCYENNNPHHHKNTQHEQLQNDPVPMYPANDGDNMEEQSRIIFSRSDTTRKQILRSLHFQNNRLDYYDYSVCKYPSGLYYLVVVLLFLVGVTFSVGSSLDLIRFTIFNGNEVLDEAGGCEVRYNLYTFATTMISDLSIRNNSAKPAVWALYVPYLLLVIICPLIVYTIQVLVLGLQLNYYVGYENNNNIRTTSTNTNTTAPSTESLITSSFSVLHLCRVADVLWSFASVEILLLAVYLVKYKFDELVGALAGNENSQFFGITSEIGPGFWILLVYSILASLLHYIFNSAVLEHYQVNPYHKIHYVWTNVFSWMLQPPPTTTTTTTTTICLPSENTDIDGNKLRSCNE